MPRIEVEQLARSRAAAATPQPAFDLIEADAPPDTLRDLERNESSEVATLGIAAGRVQRSTA